jgi:hypothetical protein
MPGVVAEARKPRQIRDLEVPLATIALKRLGFAEFYR